MRIYSQEQTQQALPFSQLIPALQKMFAQGCEVPLRHNHSIAGETGEQKGILLLMPAWQVDKWLSVKTVSIFPDNKNKSLSGLHSVVTLYSADTGVPVAIFDGNVITSRRTAAASALAAKWLSREDSKTLLIVGAGRVAELLADAYQSVRNIERILIWNQTYNKAEQLAKRLSEQGFVVQAVQNLAAACQEADIVSCATLSTEPLIHREWLRVGTHLDLIGSFTPAMRETDNGCFVDTSVFVDTSEALIKAGDLLAPMATGEFSADKVLATLEDLSLGKHQGRQSADEITVFKSVGSALEDLAAAILAYENLSNE
ncbi:MAG: ornithine cyclodeaminase family protein [Neisseria sp.]|nr:ornithine cyclodeaminase family protein [Neisseria sp.]